LQNSDFDPQQQEDTEEMEIQATFGNGCSSSKIKFRPNARDKTMASYVIHVNIIKNVQYLTEHSMFWWNTCRWT